MSDEKKQGVRVKTPATSSAGEAFHAGANGIHVNDGHLKISDGSHTNVVAIYAPGHWHSAKIEQ